MNKSNFIFHSNKYRCDLVYILEHVTMDLYVGEWYFSNDILKTEQMDELTDIS